MDRWVDGWRGAYWQGLGYKGVTCLHDVGTESVCALSRRLLGGSAGTGLGWGKCITTKRKDGKSPHWREKWVWEGNIGIAETGVLTGIRGRGRGGIGDFDGLIAVEKAGSGGPGGGNK